MVSCCVILECFGHPDTLQAKTLNESLKLTPTHPLYGELLKLFGCVLHVVYRPADHHLVAVSALWWEANNHAATFLHDGADQTALRADDGVVEPVRDIDSRLLDVSLNRREEVK